MISKQQIDQGKVDFGLIVDFPLLYGNPVNEDTLLVDNCITLVIYITPSL